MGAPLFVRERGRAKLTALGNRLMPQLKDGFDTIERAFAAIQEDDAALLTVATTFTFANTWLAWRLGGFQVEHPGLAVRLSDRQPAGRLEGRGGRRRDPRRGRSRGRGSTASS